MMENPTYKQSQNDDYQRNIPNQNQQYPPNFNIPSQNQQYPSHENNQQYPSHENNQQTEQPIDIKSKYPPGFYLEPIDEYKTYPPLVQKLKRMELFTQLMDLEKSKGITLSNKFTINSEYEDMYLEYETHKFIKSKQVGIGFMKSVMGQMISGLEFMNQRYDPFSFQLKGWSDSFKIGMEEEEVSYNEVFGEIYEKYRGKGGKMEPELKLMFLIGLSGVSYHASQSMAKLPGLEEVLEKNPELMKKLLSNLNKGITGPTQEDKQQQLLREQQQQYQQMLKMKQQLEQQQLEQQQIAQRQMAQQQLEQQQLALQQMTQQPANERNDIISKQEMDRQNELNNLKKTAKNTVSSKVDNNLLERVKTQLNVIKERNETEKQNSEKKLSEKIVASDSYDSSITETMSLSSSKAVRGRKKTHGKTNIVIDS